MQTAFLVIILSIVFSAVLVVGIMLALRSNAAYRTGVEKACRSRTVIELIGEPVRAAFFVQGGIRGGGQLVRMRVPLSGPQGRGTVEIKARSSGAEYEFDM